MRLIDHWRTFLKRAHSVWAQIAQAAFGALSFLDPAAALAVWNLMPGAVTDRIPPSFVSAVGVLLFTLSIVTIFLRLTRQPKLEAKLKESRNVAEPVQAP